MTFVSWHVCNSRVKVGYTICWWNLSWDKIDFKDARMGRAGRVRHDTHVNMSWNHVHIAVEISKFLFSRLIWNSLAFWSPLRACAAFTLSANYLLVLPAIMHEYLLTLPFSPYFPWEFQGRQLGAIIVRFERVSVPNGQVEHIDGEGNSPSAHTVGIQVTTRRISSDEQIGNW